MSRAWPLSPCSAVCTGCKHKKNNGLYSFDVCDQWLVVVASRFQSSFEFNPVVTFYFLMVPNLRSINRNVNPLTKNIKIYKHLTLYIQYFINTQSCQFHLPLCLIYSLFLHKVEVYKYAQYTWTALYRYLIHWHKDQPTLVHHMRVQKWQSDYVSLLDMQIISWKPQVERCFGASSRTTPCGRPQQLDATAACLSIRCSYRSVHFSAECTATS
jgi:hypothetical protein